MNKIRKKLKSRRGFTLAEMLIAMLIVLMVAAVVAEGIPVAANALDKVQEASNAQLLLSTTMTALREELSMARDIQVSGKTITYTNSMGLKSQIGLGASDKVITLTQYTNLEESASVESTLVSSETASKSRRTGDPVLYTTYTGAAFDKTQGVVTFSELAVKRVDSDKVAASVESYSIRVVGNPGT